jgi:hypothetical protein
MRYLVWLICGLMLLTPMQSVNAAARLGPPVEDLQSHPERTRIVIAEAMKKPESSKIWFSISEQLSGDSPDEILLRTDEETFADVEIGRSYVVAWTDMRKNRRLAARWEKHPDGPFVVSLMGMGSTALFEDSPEIRFLFAPVSQSAEQQIDALLAQMQREDFRSRGLVISQLYLRPDLTEKMNASQVEELNKALQLQDLDPQHRDFIIRSALRLSQDQTAPWLAEELRKIIIFSGTQYDLASFVPGLVRTAARGMGQVGEQSDIDLLSTLLYANNPGVSKAALDSMDQLDSKAAMVKFEQAMSRDWIHSETRNYLGRYLRQNP